MRQVWETNYVGDMHTIHVHISWLRKALGKERKMARSW
jgi:DNA-binding response OmpR family regulator